MANRVVDTLSAIFSMAETWGLVPEGANPCSGMDKYRTRKRGRFLTESEFARLCAFHGCHGDRQTGTFLGKQHSGGYRFCAVQFRVAEGQRLFAGSCQHQDGSGFSKFDGGARVSRG